jgi:hypothetical protein
MTRCVCPDMWDCPTCNYVCEACADERAVELRIEPPSGTSETDERDHAHVCPVCMDTWLHASDACEPVSGERGTSWAKCPIHEGRDE